MSDSMDTFCCIMLVVLPAVSVNGRQMEADHFIFSDCQIEAHTDLSAPVANGSPVIHIYFRYFIFFLCRV